MRSIKAFTHSLSFCALHCVIPKILEAEQETFEFESNNDEDDEDDGDDDFDNNDDDNCGVAAFAANSK